MKKKNGKSMKISITWFYSLEEVKKKDSHKNPKIELINQGWKHAENSDKSNTENYASKKIQIV